MAKNTKERILDAALEIFARDGYSGTNIKDISDAVGIVKSALYKHFDSKEAIWDAVTNQIASYYERQVGSPSHLPMIPKTWEELKEFTLRYVNFTVHDPKIIQVRKLLMTEQFRDEKTRDIANVFFLYRTEAMFTGIFSKMMEEGIMKKGDPEILAFAFTTPITSMIHLCDRDPEKEPEAMKRINDFIDLWIENWRI